MTRAMKLPAKPKTPICYGDSDLDDLPYEVELGDEVEFEDVGQFGPATHCGEITAIQPKNRTAKVRYRDETDWTKDGEPKSKVALVPVAGLTLIRRVM